MTVMQARPQRILRTWFSHAAVGPTTVAKIRAISIGTHHRFAETQGNYAC